MKKQFYFLILFFISIGLSAQTTNKNMNKYIEEWNKIEKLDKDDQPQSAINVVDKILQQAIDEKNTQQVIKALIFKNKYKIVINTDDNLEIFNDLENLLLQSNNASEKSLLHSIIGELYLKYYQNNGWNIDQRSKLTDYIPEDMKEWPSNIFFEKAITHFNQSIEDKTSLLNETTKKYDDIIKLGEDSQEFYPTLYDFLLKRTVKLSQIVPLNNMEQVLANKNITIEDLSGSTKEFVNINIGKPKYGNDLITLAYFQLFLSSLAERNLLKSVVLTELDRYNYLKSKSYNYRTNYLLDDLINLQKEHENNEISVEIINQIVNCYYQGSNFSLGFVGDKENQKKRTLAYEWLQNGIEKYPNYKRINILKSRIASVETPSAIISGRSIFYPNKKEKTFTITYNNLDKATVKVYSVTGKIQKDNNTDETIKDLVKEFDIELNSKTTYIPEEKEFNLNIDKVGNYEIELVFNKAVEKSKTGVSEFYISRLQAFSRQKEKNEYEFYVVDRVTGTPVKGATIEVEKSGKLISTLTTNNQGFATIKLSESLEDYSLLNTYRYRVLSKEDKPYYYNYFSFNYQFRENRYNNNSNDAKETIQIFTDRNIYRPGQTLYFKAIIASVANNQYQELIKNKSYEIKLLDVNGQDVATKTLKTNDFGSISGEFILPQGGITGTYQLKINDTYYYMDVEEYKRPTFQVTFDKINKTYAFGDEVTLIGHAENFSGIKLQDALVNYTITKNSFWRWLGGPSETIKNSNIRTADDGSFEITFTIPKNDSNNSIFWRNIYSFNVSADITDINGETQSGEYSFAVGDVSMILDINIPDKLDKQADNTIEIKANNLDGQSISANGTYILYKVSENDTIKQEILKGDFSTGEQKLLSERLKKVESGKYLIELKAKDSNGKDVESESEFILYSANDKRPPIDSNDWQILKNIQFNEDENAEIILGISAKNITVLYELMKGNKVFDRQQIKFNDENRRFIIPYNPEYGSDVYAIFTYMVDEEIFQNNILITKKEQEKKLNLKLEVFRDKLRPGQHEEWRISVKNNENNPVLAELLTSMYDSSIDKIRQTQSWSFRTLYRNSTYPIYFNDNTRLYGGIDLRYNFETPKIASVKPFSFDKLKWFDFSFALNSTRVMMRGGSSSAMASPAPESDVLYETSVNGVLQGRSAGLGMVSKNKVSDSDLALQEESSQDLFDTGASASQPQIRQNFNETAFFYPHLRTDENGETIISFTVPESNTIWKFRALAYDKAFNTGTLEALTVSRKELMVTPNLPRFMRHGDRTSISTKISNLSDNNISGKVRIEFFDPVTEKPISLAIENITQSFSLQKDASGSAEWIFEVPADIDLIGCRIIAESESFSDGEQHSISVLPNKMLVTESMPMNVNNAETKKFTFNKLVNSKSESLVNYKLTLEYASNPAWYAVQALPTLSNPANENAVNWFASYYANTLGYAITVQYPKVTAMINAWKKEGATKESLISKLQKNEELKAVLLEETPWVLEAKDETEQMQRLSLLFDLNNTTQKTNAAITKLAELQNSDGSWSWMKGFYPSRSITQYILYGFTNLIHLGAVQYPSNVKEMQMKAIQFIDKQILNDYESLKKNNKEWKNIKNISTTQLEYLYVRSFYRDIPINVETREAERFYTSVVEKNWTSLNLYQRSILAIVARKNGNKDIADKIIKSLRERATINNEMGMYWANNKSNVFLSLSAVSTHVFLMEAFKDAKTPENEMDLMKQWLLKQKQTQTWESTHASVDAIYALLSTGSDWFAENSDITIKIGDQMVKPESKETGTGYIKETWDKSEINPSMSNVQITKSDNGPSYGTLYWQYYEDLDKITESKNTLNVDKKLFIESPSNTGKDLSQITENNPLKVGDKVIVRLTVRVDRDMEFVHLKDMRASCFEPIETLSGNKWQNSVIYYQATKDASTNFYFDHLPKGTYVFEYPAYVNRTGEYSNGITTIQCMYAPEFVSHTKGIKVVVK